jgi:predicted naringenin-chalcone synthase
VAFTAHINRIASAVPPHDIHPAFLRFARTLLTDSRSRTLFERMAAKAQIEQRFSILPPAVDPDGISIDAQGVYSRGRFPSTAQRMQLYEKHAPRLAEQAVTRLALGGDAEHITHVIVTSCTGMYAPGIEFDLIDRCGLRPNVERTLVGFMGCYAAINGLKLAHHIVRSAPTARVLLVNLELCSLHFQETTDVERLLSFLLFGDGCAASLISAEPEGFAIDGFPCAVLPETRQLITWRIADLGFDMFLSGRVPAAIQQGLAQLAPTLLDGVAPNALELWAVHPGGRSVLDAVTRGLELCEDALFPSRNVLQRFGNMSSPTVMFVLEQLLASAARGERGCAMSFGPGLSAEAMRFHKV